MMKVENMTSSRSGREVANQFIIRDDTRLMTALLQSLTTQKRELQSSHWVETGIIV